MPLTHEQWDQLILALDRLHAWLIRNEPLPENPAPAVQNEAYQPFTNPAPVNIGLESTEVPHFTPRHRYVQAGTTYRKCQHCNNAAVHFCPRIRNGIQYRYHCAPHTSRHCPAFDPTKGQEEQCAAYHPIPANSLQGQPPQTGDLHLTRERRSEN